MEKKIGALAFAFALVLSVAVVAPFGSAHAFSSSSSARIGGITYKVSANSCNVFWKACTVSSSVSSSKAAYLHHSLHVRARGTKATVTLSKNPSLTLSGNSTSMGTLYHGVWSKGSISTTAKPGATAWGVGGRGHLKSNNQNLWTNWTL